MHIPSLLRTARRLAAVALLGAPLLGAHLGAQGFTTGAIYAGPRIWTGNLNGALAIGVQAEKGLTKPGRYGSGVISGGVGVDRYSWSTSFPGGKYSYSVIPLQVFSNYHFKVASQPKLDPYAGLALVYQYVSASTTGVATGSASASSTDIAGQAGARYFINEKFAVQGQLGFGYGTLSLGATWRF
jgi:hypothetical protein